MTQMPLLAGTWIPPNNYVTGDTEYLGVPGTVIASWLPDTEFVNIGPRCILRNVSIYDAFGMDPIVMRPSGSGKNGPRFVQYLENASDVAMVSTHWDDTSSYVSGGKAGVDSPIDVIRSYGDGSAGLFVEAHEKTHGLHVWALEFANAIMVEAFGKGAGIRVIGKPGSNPPYGYVAITTAENHRSIHVQPDCDTDQDVAIVSGHKTSGSMLAFYQAVSNFAGTGIHMNFGNGGRFTGSFLQFDVNGAPVFKVTHDGDIVGGKLAKRIAALEAAVAEGHT